MEREWTGNARRLSQADRAEIERLIQGGETFATATAAVGCSTKSTWQRGSNENTNGLLRQYFPRKADLSLHTAAHLNAVARELNNRPRQTLHWMKPSEVFGRAVASID